jgi:hypothetical protein
MNMTMPTTLRGLMIAQIRAMIDIAGKAGVLDCFIEAGANKSEAPEQIAIGFATNAPDTSENGNARGSAPRKRNHTTRGQAMRVLRQVATRGSMSKDAALAWARDHEVTQPGTTISYLVAAGYVELDKVKNRISVTTKGKRRAKDPRVVLPKKMR